MNPNTPALPHRPNEAASSPARPIRVSAARPRLKRALLPPMAVLLASASTPQVLATGSGEAGPPECPYISGRVNEGSPPASLPWLEPARAVEERVELLLAEMTLVEKVDLATGEFCNLYGFFNAPIARLQIPALTMADGPSGVRISGSNPTNGAVSTAFPAPIALAASWDPQLASTYGDLLGREAFMTGHNVQLGPAIDIARDPRAGRGFETFGEDPFLQSEIAVAYVRALQAHPVLADAKHAQVYNQETGRLDGVNAVVSERAIMEIYSPPFEALVREADVGTAMCSFNKVNGVYACESSFLQNELLKGRFGFDGFVMSDYGATHSTVASALAGLDQEQPSGTFFGDQLVAAVNSGEVPVGVIDDKARRVLRPMFEYGLFDRLVEIQPLPAAEHGAVVRQIAEQTIVLLKNAENALPLDAAGLTSIAVIGADAANATAQGGGSSQVDAIYTVSPLEGVMAAVGPGVAVTHAEGTDPVTPAHLIAGGETAVPSSVLTPTGGAPGSQGLLAQYWTSTDFSGAPALRRIDRQIAIMLGFMNFGLTPSSVPGLPPQFTSAPFSARWTGTLTPPATGEYTLTLSTRGLGAVYLNGEAIIADTEAHATAASSAIVQLTAGTPYDLRVDYVAQHESFGTGGGTIGGEALLSWTTPEGAVAPGVTEAAEAAAAADVAIVFARDFETEGHDRPSFTLPNAQDQLIAQVVAANPRTIVVLQTGMPVTMPWLDSVPAVAQAWYGGQEQGNAIASVLFGAVNPSGKTPVTFPSSVEQSATGLPEQFPGVGLDVQYSEDVFVGYRWYDNFQVEPLFPFGHGLSYTTFSYSGLNVETGAPGGEPTANVSFVVTNDGAIAGAEVAQVYVGTLPGSLPTAPRQLAGFAKVELEPHASTTVTVPIDARSLSYWDEATDAWTLPAGTVPIYVGSSSRDIRLTGSAEVVAPAP